VRFREDMPGDLERARAVVRHWRAENMARVYDRWLEGLAKQLAVEYTALPERKLAAG
jgi:hypothetical protein